MEKQYIDIIEMLDSIKSSRSKQIYPADGNYNGKPSIAYVADEDLYFIHLNDFKINGDDLKSKLIKEAFKSPIGRQNLAKALEYHD